MKKTTILLIIILLSFIVNLLNIRWGLPNEDHIYSYNADETAYLTFLSYTNLEEFDLDPKEYFRTHLPVYYTGLVLKLGNILGLYEIKDKEFYKQHPDQFANIILLLRIFCGKIPLLIMIFVSFLIGKELINENFGLVFSAIIGFLPTFIVNSNYSEEHLIEPLFTILVFYFTIIFFKKKSLKYLILAAISCGLSVSTKQTGILSLIFILGVLLDQYKRLWKEEKFIKYIVLSIIFVILSFSLTSPFYMKFLILRIFSPDSIQPDLYGMKDFHPMTRFNAGFMISSILEIIKTNFFQLGGILFLFFPIGIYFKRKENIYKIIIFFIIVFYILSSFAVYHTDSRLGSLVYFLTFFGAIGFYFLYVSLRNKYLKIILASVIILNLCAYTTAIIYRYNKIDNRQIASEWIEENILRNNNVKIGLHENPWNAHPDIITKEWMHNAHPESSFYPDRYNEIFIIPDSSLIKYDLGNGKTQFPEKELLTIDEKINWLEKENPQFIVLGHGGYEKYVSYLNKCERYSLIKYLSSFDYFGLGNLGISSCEYYIYQLNEKD